MKLTTPRLPCSLALGWALASAACSEPNPLPGEPFTGVIEAVSTVETPLSQTPACVAGVRLWTRSGATKKGSSSSSRPHPHWAQGATLMVDGNKLRIEGAFGSPSMDRQGDTWRWGPDAAHDPAIAALRGWGHDATLDALTDPSIDASYTHVEATEQFTPCGESLTLRAVREGDTLKLVDTNPAESANALSFFAKLFMGFFLFLVLPIIAMIVTVIRKARRN